MRTASVWTKSQMEEGGESQRQPRMAGRRRILCRSGNMARLRTKGLARVVCGELEKATMAAQSGQAVMQVMLNLLVL